MAKRRRSSSGGFDLNSASSRKSGRGIKRRKTKNAATRAAVTVLCVCLAVVVAFAAFAAVYVKSMLGNVKREQINSSDIGITSAAKEKYTEYTTIALLGLDSRQNDDAGRSDAVMLITFDRVHNKIKLTSVARDSYVAIERTKKDGTKYTAHDKLTHAWAYGKHNLSVKTLNQNFGLNIEDFVSMNFYQFADVIDYIGGVDIDINKSEMKVMNTEYIPYLNKMGIKCSKITKTGLQHVTGGQALAYARDRYTGSDLDRGSRQREVLMAMYDSVKDLSVTKYPGRVSRVLDKCTTSLSDGEMTELLTWVATNRPTFEQLGLPDEACNGKGQTIKGTWYYVYDLDVAASEIQAFLHETGSFAKSGSDGASSSAVSSKAAASTKPAQSASK